MRKYPYKLRGDVEQKDIAVNFTTVEMRSLESLHWLPVHLRIHVKIICFIFKALHKQAPGNLSKALISYLPSGPLDLMISVCWWFREFSLGSLLLPMLPHIYITPFLVT